MVSKMNRKHMLKRLFIPVLEEHLQVSKQLRETGNVRISKKVSTYQDEVAILLMHEEATVKRKTIIV